MTWRKRSIEGRIHPFKSGTYVLIVAKESNGYSRAAIAYALSNQVPDEVIKWRKARWWHGVAFKVLGCPQ